MDGCFYFDEGGVVVLCNRKGTTVYYAISETDGGIFFEDKVGDEDVIAFRLGNVVFCNDDDDELFCDDDVVIRA